MRGFIRRAEWISDECRNQIMCGSSIYNKHAEREIILETYFKKNFDDDEMNVKTFLSSRSETHEQLKY